MIHKNMYAFHPLWCIEETSFNEKTSKHFEGVFAQGNGYMSVRGSYEEGLINALQNEAYAREVHSNTIEAPRNLLSKYGTFMPGIFGKHPALNEVIINLPYILDMQFELDGEKLDMQKSKITNYKRWIDFRDGSLYRSFVWEALNGAKLAFSFHRFISMHNLHLCIQSVDIHVLSGNGALLIKSGINANVTTGGFNHFKSITTGVKDTDMIFMKTSTNMGNVVYQTSYSKFTEAENKISFQDENYVGSSCTWDLNNQHFNAIKYSAMSSDRDIHQSSDPCSKADRFLKEAIKHGYEAEYKAHCAEWAKKWEISDVQIEGDDKAQLSIRFSIYHLIRSNASQDPRVAICAKGHAGETYSGRYFWDTEIFLLPFFIYTNPEAAKNLLMFRYHSLPGAKKNALNYGCSGAKYAWESSLDGVENCFVWTHSDNEIHVTADIAYAIWHYYKATDDIDFMHNFGIEILTETSKYWSDRVDKNSDGSYTLIDVCGPDEYKPFSTDNAFTNRMVKFNLSKTVEFFESLAEDKKIKLFKRFEIDDSFIKKFAEIASKLPIPIDAKKNLVLQSSDFYKYADVDIDKLWKDKSKPFFHFVSHDKLYRSKNLKQADVMALMTLFRDEFSPEQLKIAYAYYEPITTHDSSLSPVMHALVALWLKKDVDVERFLKKALELDLNYQDKGGAADGIHIANCGALWQLMVLGFAGLPFDISLNQEPDTITPSLYLPKNWKSLKFKMIRKGIKYAIEVTHHGCVISHA